MRDIAQRLLSRASGSRPNSKPPFVRWRAATENEIALAEQKVGTTFPAELRAWLLLAGYGDINDDLSFRSEWLHRVDHGALRGAVMFAQDTLGNFYAWSNPDERIVFFARSESKYAVLASSFRSFMEELERRDYRILDWIDSLECRPYN